LQADFPSDDEIRRLLETARSDEAEVRKEESLADVRQLLTARRYEECIALLEDIQAQFGNDSDVQKLLDTAREYRAEQHKRERMAQARTLLSGRRYEACINLLTELQQELPDDEEVSKSLETARQDQAEYARRQKLEEARDLLAAQRFTDAMAVLEAMLSANPQDSAVLKLRSLILREQEKESRAQRLRTEWERLKKLVSEKAYTEVVTQGEELLREFPGDADLVRLVGFARGQQAQTEQELRLTKAVEQVQELMKAGRFAEASASARASLESFPQNSKLEILLQEAQAQEKKEMVRQLIERRVREIKVKINAGELSDAKKLAQETLDTLGPDTDIRQLLSSAEIEHDAREKRRLQDQKLETIRSLVRAGKLDEASTTLDEVVTKGDFHAFDPRVYQVADEIESARQAGATTSPAEVEDQPAPRREYAMLQGPPPPSEAAPDPPAIEPVAMAPPAPPAPASNPPPTLMTGIVGPRTDNLPDVERRLATFIGPVAKILVKKAAARTSDTGELYNQLAASLEREADRRAFLASVAEVSHISTTGHAPPQPSGLVSGAGKTAAPGSPELTREAIEHAARLLAPYVGPISSVLAKRVAQRADSLRAFYRLLAEHVDDETQRARFLHESGFAA
jgi:anti-sigma28 factor (negative regulator of flagellin synthesis)